MKTETQIPSLDLADDGDLWGLLATLDAELHLAEARRVQVLRDLELQLSACEGAQ